MTKSLIVAPFIPISSFVASHRAAQGVIYADQIRENGEDITINFGGNVVHDFNQFDKLYVYHGNDWGGHLNLYGGTENFPYIYNFANLTKFKGPVVSLVHEFPNYWQLLHDKFNHMDGRYIGNKTKYWGEVDWDNLLEMQKAPVVRYPRITENLVIGDSHAICMYRPGWTVNSVPYKTLFGAIKMGFDEFMRDPYEGTDIKVKNLETYFGNIDVRHHLCRQENPAEAASKLADDYLVELARVKKSFDLETVSAYELLPCENESRPLPKSGYYEKKPFWGSWAERMAARKVFNDRMEGQAPSYGVRFIRWTDYLLNDKGELAIEYMEYKKSVHLSRASYPHWDGMHYNEDQIKGRRNGIPKVIAKKEEVRTLEDIFG